MTSRWPDARPRYSDLLAHLTPPGAEQARPPAPRIADPGSGSGLGETTGAIAREAGLTSRADRPTSLRSVDPISLRPVEPTSPGMRGYDLPTPSSAPPYPYEGDLEEPPPVQQRAAVPLVRPATPRADWAAPEPSAADEPKAARPSYDPSSFPRRVSYEQPAPADPPGYTPPAAYAAFGNRPPAGGGTSGPADPGPRVLPQRVPAQPDVPRVPEPPLTEPTAETPALARIATHLRRGDVQPRERQEGFDVQAILAAVRGVDGVRDASLRSTPSGAHSLRLDLAEGADPAEVSRRVARLLQDRMGLDAAMKGDAPIAPPAPLPVSPARPQSLPPPPPRPQSAPPALARPQSPAPAPISPSPLADRHRAVPDVERVAEPAPVIPPQPGPARPYESGPIESRPIESRPAEPAARPVESRPVESRPVESRPVESRPVESRPVESRPAESRPADPIRPAEPARPAEYVRAAAPTRPAEADRRNERPKDETEHIGEVVPVDEPGPPRPLYPGDHPYPRIVIENVHVNTFGTDATVEVRLGVGGRSASGNASGPSVDGYLLRLCAQATAGAVDELLATSQHPDGPARCFVEHAAAVPFGNSQVAVVVLLLSCNGWVEQLAGSAVVTGDDRHAMVRATLAAVNRRLEALLSR
ncbi:Daple [Actinoplanes sp. CA-142083]|uniref:Daple n=1 Tax=Actinoplanes sp. CA-142083 TaxID=3239903 RepID=UPI003D9002CB